MKVSDVSADFVTVAEAARRLHLSERQARRLVSRLPDSDRQTGPPLLVRVSALTHQGQTEAGYDERATPDTLRDKAGQKPDSMPGSDAALVEALRSEVEYLRAALVREQETARAALSALHEERERLPLLLAAATRAALPKAAPDIVNGHMPDNAGHKSRTGPDSDALHSNNPQGQSNPIQDEQHPQSRRGLFGFWRRG